MSIPKVIFVPSSDEFNDEGAQQQICRSDLFEGSSGHSRWEESPGKASLDSNSKIPCNPPSYPRRRRSNERERLSIMPTRRPAQTYPKCLDDDDEEAGPSVSADTLRRQTNSTANTTTSLKRLVLAAHKTHVHKTGRKLSHSM